VRDYFNAGVLLIDLPLWRAERVSERALEYLARNPSSPICDQDALNVACDGRWTPLDPRWNFQDHYDKVFADMEAEQLPGIVHFVTTLKPWKPDVCSLNAGFYDGFRSRTRFRRGRGEILQCGWFRVRRFLGRSSILRAIRDRVVPCTT
jgi:lipopolysaccharide biosynthesis glycosyltransferase